MTSATEHPSDMASREKEEPLLSRFDPKPAEGALWTLVGGVGQFVMAGWCLTIAVFMMIVGYAGMHSGGSLLLRAVAVLLALFVVVGIALAAFGVRFLARAFAAFWMAWRKALFLFAFRRSPDRRRALQAIVGDPVLEPYAQHLIRRGVLEIPPL